MNSTSLCVYTLSFFSFDISFPILSNPILSTFMRFFFKIFGNYGGSIVLYSPKNYNLKDSELSEQWLRMRIKSTMVPSLKCKQLLLSEQNMRVKAYMWFRNNCVLSATIFWSETDLLVRLLYSKWWFD